MDYNIIESATLVGLMKDVNGYIEIGWIPTGGVAPIRPHVSGPVHYYQAMFKPKSAASEKPVRPIVYRERKKKRIRRWKKKPADYNDDPGELK